MTKEEVTGEPAIDETAARTKGRDTAALSTGACESGRLSAVPHLAMLLLFTLLGLLATCMLM